VVGWLVLAPVAVAQQAAPAVAEGRVVDRVVAVIEGQVLTLSELEFEARVALVQRGGVRAAQGPLDEQALRVALELVINQRLLVMGADRLRAFPAERSEVEARLRTFREHFESEPALLAFLARYDADLDQLTAVLERGVRAERILDSRIRLRAQVNEVELRRYYQEHAAQLGGSYEQVRESLRQRLVRERYTALAAAEFSQVRSTARIRRVAPFAREAQP
jgi:hypothetical protein